MNTATDDRTFESGIPLSPEQQKEASDYFAEKGYDVTTEETVDPGKPAEATQVTEPSTEDAAAAAKPAESAAPAGEDSDLDAESRADWQSAKTDGERLGKYAKRTKKLHELTDTVAERDRRLVEVERELAETKGRLAERQASAPAAGSPLLPAKPVEQVKQLEPPKAKEFSKPQPEAPDYNNFLEQDDPVAAHAAALAKYTKEIMDWTLDKRDFEAGENRRIAQETSQQDTRKQQMDQKFEGARQVHSDFDARTGAADYSGMLGGILMEVLDDGLEIGYQLALPENAETRKKINEYTKNIDPDKDPAAAHKAMNRAIQDLAVFRYSLESKAKPAANEEAAAPAKPVVPAAAQPAPAANGVPSQVTTPPSNGQPPRREEAAPAHIKGRTATPATRLEDIPEDDYDARRAARKQMGMVTS